MVASRAYSAHASASPGDNAWAGVQTGLARARSASSAVAHWEGSALLGAAAEATTTIAANLATQRSAGNRARAVFMAQR
jgi:hypothetical protein